MFKMLKKVLSKTAEAIKEIAPNKSDSISRDEFEEILLEADVNYELVEKILEKVSRKVTREQAFNALIAVFDYENKEREEAIEKPFVDMIVGVNGAGKTTTISKLAHLYKEDGKKVMLGAGDTFRAAAIEQLSRWAKILDIPIVSTQQGHDPSAVVFDSISSAKAKDIDHLIIDTAGRLHTQTNLAQELQKMIRVAKKAMPSAPHRKLLIIDGTQGTSAINQAKAFNEIIGIDGIIITKLDGTAKGGALFSIADELQIPIYYIGIGEQPSDLMEFNAKEYVDTILDEIFE